MFVLDKTSWPCSHRPMPVGPSFRSGCGLVPSPPTGGTKKGRTRPRAASEASDRDVSPETQELGGGILTIRSPLLLEVSTPGRAIALDPWCSGGSPQLPCLLSPYPLPPRQEAFTSATSSKQFLTHSESQGRDSSSSFFFFFFRPESLFHRCQGKC